MYPPYTCPVSCVVGTVCVCVCAWCKGVGERRQERRKEWGGERKRHKEVSKRKRERGERERVTEGKGKIEGERGKEV